MDVDAGDRSSVKINSNCGGGQELPRLCNAAYK